MRASQQILLTLARDKLAKGKHLILQAITAWRLKRLTVNEECP